MKNCETCKHLSCWQENGQYFEDCSCKQAMYYIQKFLDEGREFIEDKDIIAKDCKNYTPNLAGCLLDLMDAEGDVNGNEANFASFARSMYKEYSCGPRLEVSFSTDENDDYIWQTPEKIVIGENVIALKISCIAEGTEAEFSQEITKTFTIEEFLEIVENVNSLADNAWTENHNEDDF